MGTGNNFLDILFIIVMAISFLSGVVHFIWAIKGTLDGSSGRVVFIRYAFSIVFFGLSGSFLLFLP
jgi:hypothetical protein